MKKTPQTNPASIVNETVSTVLSLITSTPDEVKGLRNSVSSMGFAMSARDGKVTVKGLKSAVEGKSSEDITVKAKAIRQGITDGKVNANNEKLRAEAAAEKAAKAEAPVEVEG
jgi:hypothetical protein